MEWKQMMAILFAAMLVLSVAPSFAYAKSGSGDSDDDDSDDSSDDASDDSSDDSSDDNSTDDSDGRVRMEYRENLKGRNGELRTEIRTLNRERLEDGRELRVETRTQMRTFKESTDEERKQMLDDMKERRTELREDYKVKREEVRQELKVRVEEMKELRGQYKDERKSFLEARDEYKQVCKSLESDDCKEAKEKLAGEGKHFMGNAAEQMLNIIERMKTRIENHPEVSDEVAADVISQLDARAVAITAAKEDIDALTNTSTVNETKAAADALRGAWSEAKVTVKLSEGVITLARHQEFMDHLVRMESRFKEARDKLAAAGEDVTALNAEIAKFSEKLATAKTAYDAAMTDYVTAMDSVTTEKDANTLLKSTKETLGDIKDDLDNAKDDVRAIVKELKDIDPKTLETLAAQVAQDSADNATVETDDSGDDSDDDSDDDASDNSTDDNGGAQ